MHRLVLTVSFVLAGCGNAQGGDARRLASANQVVEQQQQQIDALTAELQAAQFREATARSRAAMTRSLTDMQRINERERLAGERTRADELQGELDRIEVERSAEAVARTAR